MAGKDPLVTLDLKLGNREAIELAELIQVSGHHELTLNARRSITIVRRMGKGKDYEIEIDDLKPSGHQGYEMVQEAIEVLIRAILVVKHADGKNAERSVS